MKPNGIFYRNFTVRGGASAARMDLMPPQTGNDKLTAQSVLNLHALGVERTGIDDGLFADAAESWIDGSFISIPSRAR